MRMKGNFEEFINNNSNNIFYKNQKSQIQNSEYPIKKNDEIKEEEKLKNKITQKNDEKIDNIIYSSKNNNSNQRNVKRYKHNIVEHKSLKITYKLKDINTNQLPPNSKRDDDNKVNQEKLYVYSIVKKTLNREKSSNYFSKKNFPNNNTFSKSPRLESKTKENLNHIEE